MTPWLLLTVLVATLNLALLHLVRGRWGRISLVMAAASLAGTAAGDAVAARTGLEVVRIGDFHLVAASVGAQLVMLASLLLAALLQSPPSVEEPSVEEEESG